MFGFDRTLFLSDDSEAVDALSRLPSGCYYLEHNGRIYENLEAVGPNRLVQLHFRLHGGKGGFGSLLRSFRIHKSTNQLMCRDLSGRRLADVKEEEKLNRWIAKKEQREKEKQMKKQEKLERLKRGPAKHEFTDQKYLQARDRILDQTEDAIEAGMRALEEKRGAAGSETSDSDADAVSLSSQSSSASGSSSSSSEDFDLYDTSKLVPTTSANASGSRKRKLKRSSEDRHKVSKRLKVEYTSNIIFEYFCDKILEEIAQLAYFEAQKQNKTM